MKRFIKSFKYAFQGIRWSVTEQPNLKILLFIAVVVVSAGFYFRITDVEWCVVLLCIGLVIGLEMMNSAIESLVDLITKEQLPLAGRIKDMAAGAVLLVAMIAVVIGVIIFGKYFVQLNLL
jgi:diacylglycerol kinase